MHAYHNSVAPGTVANRNRQARVYLTFCILYNVPCLCPPVLAASMYVQFLANTYPAPNTIKNYISGARFWIRSHKGDDSAFASPKAASVLVYNVKNSTHVQTQPYPITISDLTVICQFIDSTPYIPLAVKPAILIGYFAFLRVSNLLAPSPTVWSGPHNLFASDVVTVPDGLIICLRSTKTLHRRNPVLIRIFSVPNSTCCPLLAWSTYLDHVKPSIKGPAFMLDQTTPLTSPIIVNIMRLALESAGNKNFHRVSMHSLRRGGAQAADKNGATHQAIKRHGTWSSDSCLKTYLN